MALGLNCVFFGNTPGSPLMPSGDAEQPKGGLGDEFSSVPPTTRLGPSLLSILCNCRCFKKKKKGVDCHFISFCFLVLNICPFFPGLNNLIADSQSC